MGKNHYDLGIFFSAYGDQAVQKMAALRNDLFQLRSSTMSAVCTFFGLSNPYAEVQDKSSKLVKVEGFHTRDDVNEKAATFALEVTTDCGEHLELWKALAARCGPGVTVSFIRSKNGGPSKCVE